MTELLSQPMPREQYQERHDVPCSVRQHNAPPQDRIESALTMCRYAMEQGNRLKALAAINWAFAAQGAVTLDSHIEELGLDARNCGMLTANGFITVKDLLAATREQLEAIHFFGPKNVAKVLTADPVRRFAPLRADSHPAHTAQDGRDTP